VRGCLEKPPDEWHGLLCSLDTAEGWLLKGTVVGALENKRPMLASYEVLCDDNWLTQRVQVERTVGKVTKALILSVESGGLWRSSGQELSEVRRCLDVDLAVTPATNTLPIRRLDLGIGKSESVTAAWIKFPDLEIQPLSQRYTLIAKNIYRYASDTGFSAEIEVDDLGLDDLGLDDLGLDDLGLDDLGLVVTYPGGWERIAAL
jgi:hypothetical protein